MFSTISRSLGFEPAIDTIYRATMRAVLQALAPRLDGVRARGRAEPWRVAKSPLLVVRPRCLVLMHVLDRIDVER